MNNVPAVKKHTKASIQKNRLLISAPSHLARTVTPNVERSRAGPIAPVEQPDACPASAATLGWLASFPTVNWGYVNLMRYCPRQLK